MEKYMTDEYAIEWCRTHCKPQAVVDEIHRKANAEAEAFCEKLTDDIIQASDKPMVYNETMFSEEGGFCATMFMIGKRYKDNADIEVAYSKQEQSDGRIFACFTIRNLPNIKRRQDEEKKAAFIAAQLKK